MSVVNACGLNNKCRKMNGNTQRSDYRCVCIILVRRNSLKHLVRSWMKMWSNHKIITIRDCVGFKEFASSNQIFDKDNITFIIEICMSIIMIILVYPRLRPSKYKPCKLSSVLFKRLLTTTGLLVRVVN